MTTVCRSVSRVLALATLLPTTPAPSVAQSDSSIPRTVDDAVHILRTRWLAPSDLDRILRTPKGMATSEMQLPFGMQVRNAFRLWQGNTALLQSCGVPEPEACSAVIFARLWDEVRLDADSGLIRALDCQFGLAERVQIRYAGFYRLRLAEILDSMQVQVDRQLPRLRSGLLAGCPKAIALHLRPQGGPTQACWARIEFSEDGRDPVSLESFLGWFAWRNAFTPVHVPPYLELRFYDPCAWPTQPPQFQPTRAPG